LDNALDLELKLPFTSSNQPQKQRMLRRLPCLLKREQVENPESELYRRMPEEAAGILFECMQTVQRWKYKKTPQYSVVAGELANLTMPVALAAASKKKAAPTVKRAVPAAAAAVLPSPDATRRSPRLAPAPAPSANLLLRPFTIRWMTCSLWQANSN
jgi:hypothetical protein